MKKNLSPLKDEIKNWLAVIGQNRKWLAERCGVSKSTVNNWLSTSINISPRKLALIQKLMDETRAATKLRTAPPAYVTLEMTLDEEYRWQHAALTQRPPQTLRDWAYDSLNRAAADWHRANHPLWLEHAEKHFDGAKRSAAENGK